MYLLSTILRLGPCRHIGSLDVLVPRRCRGSDLPVSLSSINGLGFPVQCPWSLLIPSVHPLPPHLSPLRRTPFLPVLFVGPKREERKRKQGVVTEGSRFGTTFCRMFLRTLSVGRPISRVTMSSPLSSPSCP